MYYLSVMLFAIICGFYSDLGIKGYFSNFGLYKYIFWNMFFLNFLCPSLPGVFNSSPINGALWTIKIEIGFYIVLPFLIYFLKKFDTQKKRNIFLSIIYIASVLWSEGCKLLPIPQQISHQLPGFMSFFVMGMIFLFNWNFLIRQKKYFIIPAIIVFSLHYLFKTEILMPIALTCILMWAGSTMKLIKSIGIPSDYLYGMYLFHFPVINILTLK